MHYRRKDVTAYCECDVNNRLKPSGILRYMQQASSEHMCSLGISPEKLYRENLAFLLSKTNLRIYRAPVCGEILIIRTALTAVKGARFVREYLVDGEQGEPLAHAYSLWVLCDIENHKILRPASFPYELELSPPELDNGDIAIPKNPTADILPQIRIPVRYSHIDVNNHVNNCFYADFACDALPFGELVAYGVSVMALSFGKEAAYGEILDVETARISDFAYKISGAHEGERRFEAYVELSGA